MKMIKTKKTFMGKFIYILLMIMIAVLVLSLSLITIITYLSKI